MGCAENGRDTMKDRMKRWWLLDDEKLARMAKGPAMRAMRRIGVGEDDMGDVLNISLAAMFRIAERYRANGGGEPGGFYALAYKVTMNKAMRPLKAEMVQRSKRELLTVEGVSHALNSTTGRTDVIDPLDAFDAKATARRLLRPASWRPLPPFAGIDAKAFLESLTDDARALLVDLAACGDCAKVTAERLSLITDRPWTARRVKRMRSRLRASWEAFFGKFPRRRSANAPACD